MKAFCEPNVEQLVNCYPNNTYRHFDPWNEGTQKKAMDRYKGRLPPSCLRCHDARTQLMLHTDICK